MGQVYGLTPWQLFSQIIFPGALPSILVGLRYSLGLMWLTLIVAETIATTSGIGQMAMNAREFMQTDVVVLAILIYALLGKLADTSVHFLERRILQWHPGFKCSSLLLWVAAQSVGHRPGRIEPRPSNDDPNLIRY